MEDVAIKVMKIDIAVELFQTIVIVSLNMGKFDSRGQYFEEQQSYRGERKGSVTGGIG